MTKLLGKIIVEGKIKALTGLHVGGSGTGMEIGGVDSVVVRDSMTHRPYIPGSSLKGSLRSLMERSEGKPFNNRVANSWIHMCKELKDFEKCCVCRVFGVTADSIKLPEEAESGDNENAMPTLTRLMVRDALMTEETAVALEKAETDLLFTDVKTEVVIDRITSQATPRQIERVPAGSQFAFGMIFNVFVKEDANFLKYVFQAMTLLEDDSLGGQGSRGYGKIKFDIEKVAWRPTNYYATGKGEVPLISGEKTAASIRDEFKEILKKIN
ncbi:MAG TPA: type III-A CRISPR-associated RAMP protein Csm3 [Methanothrix sp.]|jgi:CRISPR-associated protein Csm3|uniref:type III-A CRISPR-associated RAMP protein Csm3 n=1 Tax=Methanothrix sp. TaxID=90426 RepID=UPI002C647348|nr:type III-A CRISPR-associated RAMP protein Csm3 [Methanothrix sp.]MDI9417932.1 type III-A CRISPR-associated RAMP protein Csm3 [Euryarchaeota archaeon]HON35429.1 type III-A CRISPR-associated RAMP protein Csm3 [Methanothrix sp.]HRU74827.1 type III-A CRISPR-associated RAMP protein Csm3 [Methanothrix sp.]